MNSVKSQEPGNTAAEDRPDDGWSIEELAVYILTGINAASVLARNRAVHLYRAGVALNMAHSKVSRGRWKAWLEEHQIARSTSYEAMALATRYESEADLASLGAAEALEACGVRKRKKKATKRPKRATKGEAADTSASSAADQADDDSEHKEAEAGRQGADDGAEEAEDPTTNEPCGWGEESAAEPSDDSPSATLAEVVSWLEHLETQIGDHGVDSESHEEFIRQLDLAEQTFGRIRASVELEVAI